MFPDDVSMAKGLDLASDLFAAVGQASFDGTGFTRPAYGPGEQRAHDIIAAVARDLGMRIEFDAALNMWMTLDGSGSDSRPFVVGSHLDAVPQGGNFDGLAGVLAGLTCAAALRHANRRLRRPLAVLATRAEESAWFGAQHIGSRTMLGTLRDELLETAKRTDSKRSLREHMLEAGADLEQIGFGRPLRDPAGFAGFLELHIEQGPVLLAAGKPVGIVTSIRGNRRCQSLVCAGEYGHSGTLERANRRDAVIAVCDLVMRMERLWQTIVETERQDLVMTFGRLFTDAAAHSVTTVPGRVEFSFDARSSSQDVLNRVEHALMHGMSAISGERSVVFSHAALVGDAPVEMDADFRAALEKGCAALAIPTMPIASGAGHDAGDFAAAGVPSAMIFVRSENGSHNPDEHMAFDDFEKGARVMAWFVERMVCEEAGS